MKKFGVGDGKVIPETEIKKEAKETWTPEDQEELLKETKEK